MECWRRRGDATRICFGRGRDDPARPVALLLTARCVAQVADFDGGMHSLFVTEDEHVGRFADFGELDQATEVAFVFDLYPVEFEDHIVHAQIGVFGWGVGLDTTDAGSNQLIEPQGLGLLLVEIVVELDAEIATSDGIILDELVGDAGNDVDRESRSRCLHCHRSCWRLRC